MNITKQPPSPATHSAMHPAKASYLIHKDTAAGTLRGDHHRGVAWRQVRRVVERPRQGVQAPGELVDALVL